MREDNDACVTCIPKVHLLILSCCQTVIEGPFFSPQQELQMSMRAS